MKALFPLAETIAQRLIARRETIAIAESSTGGLVSAALLAVPGASASLLGGAVGSEGGERSRPREEEARASRARCHRVVPRPPLEVKARHRGG